MAAKNKTYQMSFRCYFGGSADNLTKHRQELPLKDIPKWIERINLRIRHAGASPSKSGLTQRRKQKIESVDSKFG